MGVRGWLSLLLAFGCIFVVLDASAGDRDPVYKSCIQQCENTGVIKDSSVQHCQITNDDVPSNASWLHWKQLICRSDCRYHCMVHREEEREQLGLSPVKYHGKWPFKRVFGFQEPLSAIFSALNFLMHFTGWLSFLHFLKYKLPHRPDSKRTYYEYAGLWHTYAILAMNAWFWSFIFHTRDFDITEKLDYSSAISFLGYALILSLLRVFNVRDEASRVMFAAPILAFVTTHILYLNFYQMDYGWNIIVCTLMGVTQLLIWAIWAGVYQHPSRFKLWATLAGCALAMLLEIFDFPPFRGYADAHALWHATTVPLTYLWWSFVKDDAEFRTSTLMKKSR